MEKCVWYISKYVSPPSKSGVGSRGFHIIEEMKFQGVETLIITSDSNHLIEPPKLTKRYYQENNNGINILWIKTYKFNIAKSFKRMISWLDFEFKLFLLNKKKLPKPDAIIVSSLSLFTIVNGFLLKKKYKCKLIFEIRDIWPLTIVEEGGYSEKNVLVKCLAFLEKWGYKKADLIVGTMPNLGQHVENVLGYTKKTVCIPMGYNESSVRSQQAIPQEYIENNFPKDKFIVAHAGTIGITNALDTFFECAESMVDFPNVHFLMIGDGALKNYYQEKYATLTNLTFAPKVSKYEVQSVLSHCNLLFFSVHKSKVWEYGQSLNKIIDYMFSGKPVVASYTGYQSMINEAECGIFVPANDVQALKKEIVRFSEMPEAMLTQMGINGHQWIIKNRHYKVLATNYLKEIFNV